MIPGDATVNADAPIICCTAEILSKLALREGERGVAWQVPLLALPQTRFLLMSATLGDVSFKDRLQEMLRDRGRSAAELARRSGVPKQSISDWLAGVQPRSISQVKLIAEQFGVTFDELFFGSSEAPFSSSSRSSISLTGYAHLALDAEGSPYDRTHGFITHRHKGGRPHRFALLASRSESRLLAHPGLGQ